MENTEQNDSTSYIASAVKVGLLAGAGYLLWTNRFKAQRLLESVGISTPWLTGNAGEAITSGASKIAGSAERAVKSVSPNSFNNVKRDLNKVANG